MCRVLIRLDVLISGNVESVNHARTGFQEEQLEERFPQQATRDSGSRGLYRAADFNPCGSVAAQQLAQPSLPSCLPAPRIVSCLQRC